MTTRPLAPLTFCFVELGLLIVVSLELWMNGVPLPDGKLMLSMLDVFV